MSLNEDGEEPHPDLLTAPRCSAFQYRRACRDAEVIIKQAALKGGRSEAMQLPPGSDRPSPTDNGAGGLQKIDALWSKVWDQLNASASAGIRSLRERATEAMDTLREAEAEYDTSRRQLEVRGSMLTGTTYCRQALIGPVGTCVSTQGGRESQSASVVGCAGEGGGVPACDRGPPHAL